MEFCLRCGRGNVKLHNGVCADELDCQHACPPATQCKVLEEARALVACNDEIKASLQVATDALRRAAWVLRENNTGGASRLKCYIALAINVIGLCLRQKP